MSLRVELELLLLWSFCCYGALAVNGNPREAFSLRLVGGDSRCRGELQVRRAGRAWTGVFPLLVPQWFGARVCVELDCGPVLAVKETVVSKRAAVTMSSRACENSSLSHCFGYDTYELGRSWELNCTDSVRLVGGRSVCSGSLQIRDQSLAPSWASVCEGALGRRGAEVLCRELGCEAPLLQGALSPLGQTFHCEGNESALMDCPRNQTRTGPETCPTLQLTCEEPLRLVGGPSRCEGTLEVRHRGEWRRMMTAGRWPLESAAAVCRSLDCGSAVSTEMRQGSNSSVVWSIFPDCEAEAPLRDCVLGPANDTNSMEVVCSGEEQELDVSSAPPQPWDFSVEEPLPFRINSKDLPIPGTAEVQECSWCRSGRTFKCSHCSHGEVNCYQCNGNGWKYNLVSTTNFNTTSCCYNCGGRGKTRCMFCHGDTHDKKCPLCGGHKKTARSITLRVKWMNCQDAVMCGEQDVPHSSHLSGLTLTTHSARRVRAVSEFPEPSLVEASQRLVQEHSDKHSDGHVLQQRQTIELLALTRVSYVWRGQTYGFYISATDGAAIVEDYPQSSCQCCSVM